MGKKRRQHIPPEDRAHRGSVFKKVPDWAKFIETAPPERYVGMDRGITWENEWAFPERAVVRSGAIPYTVDGEPRSLRPTVFSDWTRNGSMDATQMRCRFHVGEQAYNIERFLSDQSLIERGERRARDEIAMEVLEHFDEAAPRFLDAVLSSNVNAALAEARDKSLARGTWALGNCGWAQTTMHVDVLTGPGQQGGALVQVDATLQIRDFGSKFFVAEVFRLNEDEALSVPTEVFDRLALNLVAQATIALAAHLKAEAASSVTTGEWPR